jgi:hypothetical protein
MTPAVADALVNVCLSSNVSFGGKDYGPDFGSRVAALPERFARQIMRDGRGRPAFLGPCTRDTARCDTATDAKTATAPCCIHGAMETLRIVARLFDHYGVRWWGDYGTLLSAASGRWFWNDKDCDVGVLAEDQEKVLRMRPLFEREGFTFAYSKLGPGLFSGGDRVKVRWSTRNTVNTDVFFWHLQGGKLHRRAYIRDDQYKGREFPAEWAADFVRVPLEGLDVPMVSGWEQLGAHRYGPRFTHMVADVRAGWTPTEAQRKNFPAARTDGVRR